MLAAGAKRGMLTISLRSGARFSSSDKTVAISSLARPYYPQETSKLLFCVFLGETSLDWRQL